MFAVIPHSSSLASGTRPLVTWTVMLVCLLVHLAAPASRELMYFPDSWNPLTMLSASVAHADWLHLLFNLLFFYAFSPIVEMIVASRLRYSLLLVLLALITHISYSLYGVTTGSELLPTLGLSGVVSGVIGLGAFFVPRARIGTLVWFFSYVRNHTIPAWILALFFIGGDILEMYEYGLSGGINLVAHISGALAGYAIGYLFFNRYRMEIQPQLEEELEYDRSQREDSGMASSYRGNRVRMLQAIEAKQEKRRQDAYISQIYTKACAGHDGEALMLVLRDFDSMMYKEAHFEELYQRMRDWPLSRTFLCTARLCIELFMQRSRYQHALEIAHHCQQLVPGFVLANPVHVPVLARFAMESRQYQAALSLVSSAQQRYGEGSLSCEFDLLVCELMEVEILGVHMGNQKAAEKLLSGLLLRDLAPGEKQRVLKLAKLLQPLP